MRTRGLAAAEAGAEKRRRVGNGGLRLASSPFVQITKAEDTRGPSPSTANIGGDHVAVSCCSINGSIEELQFTDLKVEFETTARYSLNARTSKSSTEFKAGSGAPEMFTSKPSPTTNCCRTVPAAELEEFFAAAEKDLHKRFNDKYNYDIVNDTPSEGRFEWIELNP